MADEPTILEQLQVIFGSDLSGIDTYAGGRAGGIKEALYIMNGVGTEKMMLDLDPEGCGHLGPVLCKDAFQERPSKGIEGTATWVPAVTVDSVIAGAQAPFDAMATLLVFLTGTVPDHSHE